jgi:hypothetical protein
MPTDDFEAVEENVGETERERVDEKDDYAAKLN